MPKAGWYVAKEFPTFEETCVCVCMCVYFSICLTGVLLRGNKWAANSEAITPEPRK